MKEIKIGLFMIPPLTQGGGAEKYFINLANNLSTDKNPVELITFDTQSFKIFGRLLYIIVKGNFFGKIPTEGRESRIEIKSQMGNANWIEANIFKLKKILQKYDVIYSKNEIIELLILKIIGYKNLPPVIIGVHTPLKFDNPITLMQKMHNFLYRSNIYKYLLPPNGLIHSSNKFTYNFATKILNKKSTLIYYPYSLEKFNQQKDENKTKIKFDKNKINISFLGRLSDQKGQDVLIKIIEKFKINKKINKKISLNVFGIGDIATEEFLKNSSEKYSWIKYFGHIENKYIPDILSKQNILISPAKWEVLPFNIIEAQSAGIPVISFDIPGPSDIIIDKQTGIIVKNQNQYIPKLLSYINNEYIFNKNIIIKNVKTKFDPNTIYLELKEMFYNYANENSKT